MEKKENYKMEIQCTTNTKGTQGVTGDKGEIGIVHPSFNLLNEFLPHEREDRLHMHRWPKGFTRRAKAVYLLELKGKIIKVGQSINFFRRMNDYKYQIGHSCQHLTPELAALINHTGENIKIYVRFYDDIKIRIDNWNEEVLQTDCIFAAEKKWMEFYKKDLIFD
tara:strand:+ start:90 stop:584 length:495 start_codon:yes stop_codon:yes gene_type:complete